jgi:hypothetical protein
MRLLTHNTMRNNSKEANGKGFPLRITAIEVKVVDNPDAGEVGVREIDFVKRYLPTLEWSALVKVCSSSHFDFILREIIIHVRCILMRVDLFSNILTF